MDKNINNPKVTVLMPVYNSEKYLRESIESILNQTFTNFEFLIINDGSTDKSKEIINSYNDSRIRLINNKENIGITRSLNNGLSISKGEYIARMDADDISLPKRLKIQVKFMNRHPEIKISGTWAKIIGKKNKKYIKNYSDFEKIKTVSLFKNIVIHSSVIIRKEVLNKYHLKYNEGLKYSQDYELWIKCMRYFKITNIKKYLLLYRIHQENISHQQSEIQTKNSIYIKIKQLEKLEINPTKEEKILHISTYKPTQYKTENFLYKTEKWFFKLISKNKTINYCKEPQFSQVISKQWMYICSINANYNFKIFKIFWKSELRKKIDWFELENWKIITRFLFKCLLKN